MQMEVFVAHREHEDHKLAKDKLTFMCCRCSGVMDVPKQSKLTGYTPRRVFYSMECPVCHMTYRVTVERDP